MNVKYSFLECSSMNWGFLWLKLSQHRNSSGNVGSRMRRQVKQPSNAWAVLYVHHPLPFQIGQRTTYMVEKVSPMRRRLCKLVGVYVCPTHHILGIRCLWQKYTSPKRPVLTSRYDAHKQRSVTVKSLQRPFLISSTARFALPTKQLSTYSTISTSYAPLSRMDSGLFEIIWSRNW